MKGYFSFELASLLPIPQDVILQHATSMRGVNSELMPYVRMTFPSQFERLHLNPTHTGNVIFRSWILLFGILPVDYHALRFARVDDEGFLERSSSIIHKLWEHERIIKAVADGTELHDRVRFQPRIPGIGYLLQPIYEAVFKHRHAQLRHNFNSRKG